MVLALSDYLEPQIKNLIKTHEGIPDEPLHLALRYEPEEDSKDIFIFEIIGNFAGGYVDPDQEMMEVSFGSSANFPLQEGQELHLVLTSPQEFEIANRDDWKSVQKIRQSMRNKRYSVLSMDETGKMLLGSLEA